MWMKLLLLLLVFSFIREATGQCTFQSQFSGTTWHDDTKGTLTFTETTMTGWDFVVASGQTVNSWQCLDNSSSNYLILKSSGSVTVLTKNYYSYLCLKLTSITSYSYYYYQMFAEQPNAGRERVKIDISSTLTASEVCDATFQGQDSEFHVLVKSGFEANAVVTCPESLLFSGDYLYLNNDGTFDCNGTTDVMDLCTDSTAITFDYTKCSQRIGYSENGSFYCIASLTFGGYDYAVLYNRDSTVTVTDRNSNNALNHDTQTTRFSCLCTDGSTASVSPHNCTTFQTPSAYPTLADMTTVNGYLLVFNGTKYVTCPPTTTTSAPTDDDDDGGLSSGAVAAIVIVVLLLLVAVVVIIGIYLYLRSRKNKVSESEKPIIERNGVQPRVETIDETAKGNKLLRERSTLSRECTSLSRDGTLTSLKKQGSNLSGKKVGKIDDGADKTKEEKPFLGLSFLAFCPCKSGGDKSAFDTCRVQMGGICTCMKEGGQSLLAICPCGKGSEEELADGDTTAKPDTKTKGKIAPSKKAPAVKGSKLATKDKKVGKTKPDKTKGGKGSKGKSVTDQSSNETQTEKTALKSKEKLTKSDIIIVNTPRPGSPSKGVETITVETTETSKGETKTTKSAAGEKSPKATKKKKGGADKEKGKGKLDDNATDTEKEKSFDQEKSKLAREKTDVSGVSSVRRPGTAVSLSGIDSAVHTEENIQPKPTQKKKFLDWNFLVCLQGNRSPEPKEEAKEEPAPEPVKKVPKKPEKGKGIKGKKGEKKGGPKGGKKTSGKGEEAAAKKETAPKSSDNSSAKKGQVKEGYAKMPESARSSNPPDETKQPAVERSKTLPLRREETTVTLQDGKIAVDVYVPDEKTKLQLKDTVRTVEDKKGKDTIKGITKAKTTLGTTRPNSSKEKSEKGKKGKLEPIDKPKKPVDKKTGSKGEKSKTTVGAKKKKKKT